jgi:hypothetical protein
MFRANENPDLDDLYLINGKITAIAAVLQTSSDVIADHNISNLGSIIADYAQVSDEIIEVLEGEWAEKKALERQAAEDAMGAKPFTVLQKAWNAEFTADDILPTAATG